MTGPDEGDRGRISLPGHIVGCGTDLFRAILPELS